MSKIYIIGDSHIGLGFPNKTEKWFKVHKQYFNDFLIPFLEKNVTPEDIVIHLGDLFDNRNVVPINMLNYGMQIIEKISKLAPLHIIVGNHDMYNKSDGEINSIKPFSYIPNVYLYDKTTKIEWNGKSLVMMPYVEKRKKQINELQKFPGSDYLFCHSDLNGAKMHLTSVAHRNFDKIESKDFQGYGRVFTGHIHLTQTIDNITFVGSIFQMDRNDYGDQKGIYVVDSITGEEEFIKNTVSPIFKKVSVMDEDDVDNLEQYIGSQDYIDITISNNLLLNNRRLRRKLEEILEKGSFSSMKYIDDIKSEEEEVKLTSEQIDESVSVDISMDLDHDAFIEQYIDAQNYENPDFKKGVTESYKEIIKIYKDEYASN